MAELPEGQCWGRKVPGPTVALPGVGMLLPCQGVQGSVAGALAGPRMGLQTW